MTDPDPTTIPAAVFIEPLDDAEAGALAALEEQEASNYERAHANQRPITEPEPEE